jgi:hypothetical protein
LNEVGAATLRFAVQVVGVDADAHPKWAGNLGLTPLIALWLSGRALLSETRLLPGTHWAADAGLSGTRTRARLARKNLTRLTLWHTTGSGRTRSKTKARQAWRRWKAGERALRSCLSNLSGLPRLSAWLNHDRGTPGLLLPSKDEQPVFVLLLAGYFVKRFFVARACDADDAAHALLGCAPAQGRLETSTGGLTCRACSTRCRQPRL